MFKYIIRNRFPGWFCSYMFTLCAEISPRKWHARGDVMWGGMAEDGWRGGGEVTPRFMIGLVEVARAEGRAEEDVSARLLAVILSSRERHAQAPEHVHTHAVILYLVRKWNIPQPNKITLSNMTNIKKESTQILYKNILCNHIQLNRILTRKQMMMLQIHRQRLQVYGTPNNS